MSRGRRLAFWLAVGGLVLAHMDVFTPHAVGGVFFGWMPFELAYRLLWIGAASVVVFAMAGPMWEDAP